MNKKQEILQNDFTATGYIVNKKRTRMLLIFHRKLGKWVPPGGHLKPNELPHVCVLREVAEETGIQASFPRELNKIHKLSKGETQLPTPYCILHEVIPQNGKMPKHMHVDFIYLMVAHSQKHTGAHESLKFGWFTNMQIQGLDCFQAVKSIAKNELR